MTRDRGSEEGFFEGEDGSGPPPEPPRPPRRGSPLLRRSPAIAVLVLGVCGWLLWDLWPDAAYFLSSRDPIDLGGPGAYAMERARENRFAQIRGDLVRAVPVTESRTGAARTVGQIAGTGLVVDRPGRGGPPVFEGRILPARALPDYAEAIGAMRIRGAELGGRILVLRDGERPRERWFPLAGSAVLLVLALVNLRALLKSLTS